MIGIATFAACALCVGFLALLARMAEEGLGWAPASHPSANGWEPTQRRPAGWAHRLAQACKATAKVVAVAARLDRRLAARARQEARVLAKRAGVPTAKPTFTPAPAWAPAVSWPPRPAHRRDSGTWLVWGDRATPLAEGTWALGATPR